MSGRIADRLRALSASIVADALEGRGGVIGGALKRFSGDGVVAGRAITADCAPGSLMAVFPTLEQSRPGDVLCMIGPGDTAYLGDLLATNLVERGITAAIVDGLVRDVTTLATMPLSVYARGATPGARRGKEPGVSMQTITIGGVDISPGDWIVADSDGAVVVRQGDADAVLEAAEALAAAEARIMARIQAGASVSEAVRLETAPKT